ncbi:hypothetical protein [Dyella sp. Tek66A03]|uniref:hypothetical protein n=1 Tax=Dyella sp. Tek66A03 TaxID=3458298 RepID=UPI00403E656B
MREITIGLVLGVMLLSGRASASDAATSAYVAARNKAVVEIRVASEREPATVEPRNSSALNQLQGMIKQIIGPIRLEGFPTSGTSNVDDLVEDLGYGKLDGIAVQSFDGKEQAVVSTMPLLRTWLRDTSDIAEHHPIATTADVVATFATEIFYTRVFQDDAYYYKYAELPVTSGSATGPARAILFAAAQDYPAPSPPDAIVVTVVSGEKVIVIKTKAKAPDIASCASTFKREYQLAQDAYAAYQKSRLRDKAAFDRSTDMEDRANSHYLQCYGQHLPEQPVYAELVREAQALVDKVQW